MNNFYSAGLLFVGLILNLAGPVAHMLEDPDLVTGGVI